MKYKITTVKIAPGSTIQKFTLNLSIIFTPCVRVATMVVSDINDKLSPNIAPPITVANASGSPISVCSAIPIAIGAIATTVPILVHIDNERKKQIINIQLKIRLPERNVKPRFTVESTAPIELATPENAPDSKKMTTIITTFSCAAPFKYADSLSLNGSFKYKNNPATEAIIAATVIGIALKSPANSPVPINKATNITKGSNASELPFLLDI